MRSADSIQWMVGFVILSAAISCATALGQKPNEHSGLQIKLEVSKKEYQVGSSVPLRVEFWNQGPRPIKVGFALQNETGEELSVRLEILDEATGKEARQGVQFHASPYGKRTKRDTWVTIAPEHFYGWEVQLTPFEHAFLSDVGKYKIRAFYSYHSRNEIIRSKNSDAPSEPEGNQASVFSGELISDSTTFSVVPSSP
jgi:hypothetical protein